VAYGTVGGYGKTISIFAKIENAEDEVRLWDICIKQEQR